jgi:hypothetical protein
MSENSQKKCKVYNTFTSFRIMHLPVVSSQNITSSPRNHVQISLHYALCV